MFLWIILIIYLLLMIGIGVYCHNMTKNVSDFVLGGRSIGPWFTAFAYGTSYFSAVVFIGYAGQFGWSYGASATWIGIGNAVIGSLLAWVILGRRTRTMSKYLDASTMPEYFEKRYGSKHLKTASAVIIFIFLIPYTASVYNGLSRLFESAFHIPYTACIIIMALFTALYVIMGGYTATALNDFIQGIIMLIGIIAVIVCAVNYKGGLGAAFDSLGQIPDANGNTGVFNSIIGPDPINLIGVVILTSLGTWGLPQMVQKFYAIKDDAAIRRGSIISTIFAFVVAGGSYFLGGFGRLYATTTGEAGKTALATLANGKLEYDAIIPGMMSEALPDALMGLLVVLVLSASMSTLSSLVLTSSSTMTIDLIKPFKKDMTEEKQVLMMRVLIVVFLALSVILAMNKNTYITTLMSISWGALAGAFLAPFLWGLYSKKISRAAVAFCFAWGVGITVIHTVLFSMGYFPAAVEAVKGLGWKLNILSPLNCGAFTMLSTLVLCPIISALTMKKDGSDAQHAEDAFKCYEGASNK
ncbi:MAG: sodium/solute symporter [Oscillospiraceae bacterium]|nr:sodium/solute symporter [Oscillospiraceae bacterium]